MTAKNGGRPLPWHDTPFCTKPDADSPDGVCGQHCVPGFSSPRLCCVACGTWRDGTTAEYAQAMRAEKARAMLEDELVHPDRGCAGCGGVLRLDRERLCGPCVEKDNRERQGSLFAQHGGG